MPFLRPFPRHFSLFAIAACILLLLILLLLSENQVLPSYAFVPYPFIREKIPEKCDLQCLPDPFKRPGMLYHGSEMSDTRWIPFTQTPVDNSEFHSSAILNDTPPDEALEEACPQYMKQLSRNDSVGLDWVRDRTVLFIGSSHDRNNIRNFCQEVHGTYSTIGDHTAGVCRLEPYNFTLAFWFMYGAIDSNDYSWFSPPESRPLTFESRIQGIMIPWMTRAGIRSPDLIIETSLFWDDGFLKQLTTHSNSSSSRKANEAFTYSELAWHRSRVRALVSYTRSLFGSDIPIMLRTRHFRESNKWNRVLRIFQLDQNLRHVSKELGVKLFTWGDLLEGYTEFYDGDQHFKHGPVTWLFGDMTLFYLKRAIEKKCWDC